MRIPLRKAKRGRTFPSEKLGVYACAHEGELFSIAVTVKRLVYLQWCVITATLRVREVNMNQLNTWQNAKH